MAGTLLQMISLPVDASIEAFANREPAEYNAELLNWRFARDYEVLRNETTGDTNVPGEADMEGLGQPADCTPQPAEAASERARLIKEVLSSDLRKEVEVLAAISGRAWGDLKETDLMQLFLEGAALQEQEVFNILLVDLMTIPDMRAKVLVGLRNPERSVDLIKRIGNFMGGVIS